MKTTSLFNTYFLKLIICALCLLSTACGKKSEESKDDEFVVKTEGIELLKEITGSWRYITEHPNKENAYARQLHCWMDYEGETAINIEAEEGEPRTYTLVVNSYRGEYNVIRKAEKVGKGYQFTMVDGNYLFEENEADYHKTATFAPLNSKIWVYKEGQSTMHFTSEEFEKDFEVLPCEE